jgi:hypothetical protein
VKRHPRYMEPVFYKGRQYEYIGRLGTNMMGEPLCVVRLPKSGKLLGPMPLGWLLTEADIDKWKP